MRNRTKVYKSIRLVLGILAISMCACVPQVSAQEGVPFTEEKMVKLFDWLVTIKILEMPRYKLATSERKTPMLKVVVTYRLFPRPKKMRDIQEKMYEELYFEDRAPMGCHHFMPLNLPQGEAGAIKLIQNNNEISDYPCQYAETVLHVYLDLLLNNNKLAMLIVPSGDWAAVTACLPDMKFMDPSKATSSSGGQWKSIPITVVSDPKSSKTEKTFYYKKN